MAMSIPRESFCLKGSWQRNFSNQLIRLAYRRSDPARGPESKNNEQNYIIPDYLDLDAVVKWI